MLGNEEDFTEALGFSVSGLDQHHSNLEVTAFKRTIENVVEKYPAIAVVATTLRTAKTATRNDWGALCYCGGQFYEAGVREDLEIYDRVGGGDSFAMTTPGDTTMATLGEVLQAMTSRTARIER